jgi:hypothetical protein
MIKQTTNKTHNKNKHNFKNKKKQQQKEKLNFKKKKKKKSPFRRLHGLSGASHSTRSAARHVRLLRSH